MFMRIFLCRLCRTEQRLSQRLSSSVGVHWLLVLTSVWDVFDASVPSLQCSDDYPGWSVRVRASLRSCVGASSWQVRRPVSLRFTPSHSDDLHVPLCQQHTFICIPAFFTLDKFRFLRLCLSFHESLDSVQSFSGQTCLKTTPHLFLFHCIISWQIISVYKVAIKERPADPQNPQNGFYHFLILGLLVWPSSRLLLT